MKRALIFDLDGTLTDNYVGIAGSIRHAFARLDRPAPDDSSLRGCVGPPLRVSLARLLGSSDSALIERAIAHYRERYAEIGWRENVAYDGVATALAKLAAGEARLLLCTSKPAPFARRIVDHFAFDSHFAELYCADLDGSYDDKAKLLAHALETERLDARDAIMIGDRSSDVVAAHSNGVRAIGVLWGYGSREELADADILVETPAALLDVLDRFQRSA